MVMVMFLLAGSAAAGAGVATLALALLSVAGACVGAVVGVGVVAEFAELHAPSDRTIMTAKALAKIFFFILPFSFYFSFYY